MYQRWGYEDTNVIVMIVTIGIEEHELRLQETSYGKGWDVIILAGISMEREIVMSTRKVVMRMRMIVVLTK